MIQDYIVLQIFLGVGITIATACALVFGWKRLSVINRVICAILFVIYLVILDRALTSAKILLLLPGVM